MLIKNGSEFKRGNDLRFTANQGQMAPVVSAVIYMNGSTDYIEAYGYNGIATSPTFGVAVYSTNTFFQAAMVRSA